MLRAMFIASDDLPMPGRAAMTMRLPGCRPDIRSSRSRNPVGRPVNADVAVLDLLEVHHRLVDQFAQRHDSVLVLAAGDVVDPLLGLSATSRGPRGCAYAISMMSAAAEISRRSSAACATICA